MGRADTMGLAISLVSTVPEKVRGLLQEAPGLRECACVGQLPCHCSSALGISCPAVLFNPLICSLSLQVWYCTVKGIKPWLAPDAKNTRTNEQGGHTIWYEEQQLLQVRSDRCSRAALRVWAPSLAGVKEHACACAALPCCRWSMPVPTSG